MRLTKSQEHDLARELARSLDCLTDEELQVLTDCKPGTTEAWRKRGTGPAYIRIGNRVLYPRRGVVEYLESLVHESRAVPPRELL